MNETDDIITRCPACQTSFRITGEQLKVAAGAVRCGACLRIFQAEDEIIEIPGLAAVTDTLPGLQGSAPMPPLQFAISESHVESDVERRLPDGYERAESFLAVGEGLAATTEESADEAVHEQVTEPAAEFPQISFDDTPLDESLSDSIVNQFWRDWYDFVEASYIETSDAEASNMTANDIATSRVQEAHRQGKVVEQCASEELANAADDAYPEKDHVEATELDLDEDLETLVGHLDLENNQAEIIESELLDIPPQHGWSKAVAPVMVVLLLLTGLAQYAWFNKGNYAQDVRMRPYLLTLCDWTGCVLPDYVNNDDLVTQNLVIRPHKSVEGALVVDAILRNSAVFRQRFPLLELQFEDINGHLVAMRRFSPQEYLAGELRGLRFIPANTEVRFSLEILRPGEEAVGFSLKVVHRS